MKKDIDKLMKKKKIDVIYAEGGPSKDANLYYLLNGVRVFCRYIKKQGRKPYLIHSTIEREVAEKTGYRLINMNRYNLKRIFDRYKDLNKAKAALTNEIFNDLKIKGNVVFYGNMQLGTAYNYLRELRRLNKKIKPHYEPEKDLITLARETKDKEEVARIKKAGRVVAQSFKSLLDYVRTLKIRNNAIWKSRTSKLLIGDLRAMLQRTLFEKGYVNSAGIIVAQGRDAGVPHNAGNDREVVRPGKTIVFDIFPQELGGGYFFDFTRTVCFGYASKKLKKIYKTVRDAQDYVVSMLKVGKRTVEIERSLCRFFEKNGHPTFLTSPKIQVGYCHSLGHGLGLNVHETPTFGLFTTNKDRISRGHVFTVEPGLYYPDEGFGIRLEDVIYIDGRGRVVNLTRTARRLVIEM